MLHYSTFVKYVERVRADSQPKVPGTILEYAGTFDDEMFKHLFLTYNGLNSYRGYINGGPEIREAIIFISPAMEK